MKRKCLAVGIILLFVGTAIISSGAQDIEKSSLPTSSGQWLYVGGSGSGNYSKIQDAIDNARDGDTVYVYSGMYRFNKTENASDPCVQINKSINLIGQDKTTTIINGSGHWLNVIIVGTKITLSGFTVRTDGPSQFTRIGITIDCPSEDIAIYDTIITKNYYGIVIGSFTNSYPLKNVNIYDNTFMDNTYGTVDVGEHSFIVVTHNIFSNNEWGIQASVNYTISENVVRNNTVGIDVYDASSSFNIISHNDIRDNEVGIHFFNYRANISENNFINNHKQTVVSTEGMMKERKILSHFTQNWNNNYWDNWNKPIARPIIGFMNLQIWWGGFIANPYPKTILILPYFAFDKHPAQKPYDIPGIL